MPRATFSLQFWRGCAVAGTSMLAVSFNSYGASGSHALCLTLSITNWGVTIHFPMNKHDQYSEFTAQRHFTLSKALNMWLQQKHLGCRTEGLGGETEREQESTKKKLGSKELFKHSFIFCIQIDSGYKAEDPYTPFAHYRHVKVANQPTMEGNRSTQRKPLGKAWGEHANAPHTHRAGHKPRRRTF